MYAKFSIRDEKSEKCPRFLKKTHIIHRECRFYILNYIFLVYHAGYVLRHLNCAKCPRLSVPRIFLDFIYYFFVYYLDFFAKNTFFFIANADFTYLAIYYNLIM